MVNTKNSLVYLLILVAVLALFYSFYQSNGQRETISLNELVDKIQEEQVEKITVADNDLKIKYYRHGEDEVIYSRKEQGVGIVETLTSLGVTPEQIKSLNIEVEIPSQLGDWVAILGSFLPVIIFAGLLIFMLRQAQTGNNQALSFGKSRAKMVSSDKPKVTFEDVAGVVEAKQELQEIVEFLKDPDKFTSLGARIPKGLLLIGAPGTGKTLMARAVAGEAGVPFFSISGSEFVEMFVGVGASRVRDLFDQAKRHAPCILFVDEIDAVGRQRGAGLGGSHDEREQTLNQILVEMDGFETDTRVIVVAATNRPDILDPALLRPGRFDRRVILDRPDLAGRRAILDIHVRGKPLADNVELDILARQTPGLTGADLENMVNEAAILAARQDRKAIYMQDFQEAVEKVIAGPERKSRLISDKEKNIIAHHEAGHALVMHELPNCDRIHKVSVVSRGMALGYTMPLPEEDHYLESKAKFEDEIAGLLGGRAAEELVFGDITTGASNDLERATKMAKSMVTQYGMSSELGPRTFGQKEELVFLGREISEQRDYSEEIARRIDQEIHLIISTAYGRAKSILTEKGDKLEALAKRLIDEETVEGPALEVLLA